MSRKRQARAAVSENREIYMQGLERKLTATTEENARYKKALELFKTAIDNDIEEINGGNNWMQRKDVTPMLQRYIGRINAALSNGG